MKLAEILDRPEKWCKGTERLVNAFYGVQVCLNGALMAQNNPEFLTDQYYKWKSMDSCFLGFEKKLVRMDRAWKAVVPDHTKYSSHDVWQDQPETTFEEVQRVVEEYDRLSILEEGGEG